MERGDFTQGAAVAESDTKFNLQSATDATDAWQALQPKIEKLPTLEAQNSVKLQQLQLRGITFDYWYATVLWCEEGDTPLWRMKY